MKNQEHNEMTTDVNYEDFILDKVRLDKRLGFDVQDSEIHPMLFPHQRAIVKWALEGGRRAIFAAFGLGKSFMQLECCRQVGFREGGRQLIVAPLGVRQEFKRDAEKLGLSIQFLRFNHELQGDGLYITNYESIRDGRLDPHNFNCISLDEAAVLRSYGSLTFQTFLTLFHGIKYRFVATATPSPNRFKELIHYAGFLGIMNTGDSLTRWFQRDSTKANQLNLYPHKKDEFWLWVASWAIFLQKPSDLGFSDEGYDLPKLHVHYHKVRACEATGTNGRGQYKLINSSAVGLKEAAKEKRDSMPQRIDEMKSIIAKHPDDHCIIWHDQEAERHAIQKTIPSAKAVYGSLDLETREDRILDFSDGKYQYLSTKPVLSGSGCNFQRYCNRAIFLGIGFKFSDFIQAIHRIYRFLQDKECHIHIIYAETESSVLEVLKRKWLQHEEMVENMTEIIRKYGLNHIEMAKELANAVGCKRIEAKGQKWTAVNNDCVNETTRMEEDSVDLIVTSIPFSNHYQYCASYNDFGHTDNNDHFWGQMNFLTPKLLRVLKPGRIYACHVKDRILFGNVTGKGAPTVSPFHCETIMHSMKHGFDFLGMVTVVTDVVRENNQTYRLGWSENAKDGTKMGVGSPEYIILLRKPQTDRTRGYADVPVAKSKTDYTRARWQVDAHAFWRSSGDRLLNADDLAHMGPDVLASLFTTWSLEGVYNYDEHIKIGESLELRGALPSTFMSIAPGSHHPEVWHNVNRMDTLNTKQGAAGKEKHICPLQIDIIKRLIDRYSMPGELVYDPFGGLMSVPYQALKMDRLGYGCELNAGYWADGVNYLRGAEMKKSMPTFFDILKTQDGVGVAA